MKRKLPVKKVPAELHVLRFPVAVEHPVRARCVNCDVPLSLSQPDLSSPDRLLGVCEQCKHWFFIHLIPDRTEGILCRLPDIEVIRQLSFEKPSEEPSKMRQRPQKVSELPAIPDEKGSGRISPASSRLLPILIKTC